MERYNMHWGLGNPTTGYKAHHFVFCALSIIDAGDTALGDLDEQLSLAEHCGVLHSTT
jgi:hypothetical protein